VWNFVRICHIDGAGGSGVQFGLFTCAPTAEGLVATFDHLTIAHGSNFDHTA
jgi:regulation of enolase protein 1 (concanavalin A-like superfamily)